ncbi:MAG: sensor histidine kinase [Aureliella sp.]
MSRTLLALWTIIVASIVAVVALAAVWNHQREASARLQLTELLTRQLEPFNRDIARVFEQYDRQLQRALDGFDPSSRPAIRQLESNPLVGLIVVAQDNGSKGKLIYPELNRTELAEQSLVTDALMWLRDSNFTQRERSAGSYSQVAAAAQMPASKMPQISQLPASNPLAASKSMPASSQTPASNQVVVASSHWTTWYHGRGLVLGYWTSSPGSTVTLVIVPRGRWLADIVAALPDNHKPRDDARIQLVDVEGSVVAQWGNLDIELAGARDAELAVVPPLEGWRFRMTLAPEARALAGGTSSRTASVLGAAGFSIALISLGVLITLNLSRQLRLAQQQVSFVTQVSHELRTPLTNIRMYADLAYSALQAQHDEHLSEELHRLAIIQQESSRLGRLIENVLGFARSGRSQPSLRPQPVADLEAMIDQIVDPFSPQIEELGMRIERVRGVAQTVCLDREAFEQILVNLISNALKYAASGKLLRIETALDGDMLYVHVIDDGPGIPKRFRQRVFQPFVRVSNRLEDPAGTGIGLSIARQLARRHGGDCTLEPTARGCSFCVKLLLQPCG